jgi:FixJ family two-component response regulator
VTDSTPTVVVVDDDPSIRKSLARLVRSAGLDVQTFASADDFLNSHRRTHPSCLVLDIRMPGMSGLDLQERLASDPTLPIVFITGHGDVPMSVRAMKGGAVDFLQKPFDERELLAAVRQACERAKRAHRKLVETSAVRRRMDSLTPREREVFALVVTGMLNKQIAGRLAVTERTVKAHRARVMEKMKADSLADLVRMAEKAELSKGTT